MNVPDLTRGQLTCILNGLPEKPEALSHLDVKHLIYSSCNLLQKFPIEQDRNIFVEDVFFFLLESQWMVAAPEFPKNSNGKLYYFRRGKLANDAINNHLIVRKCNWV